jgi:hypothetical protein
MKYHHPLWNDATTYILYILLVIHYITYQIQDDDDDAFIPIPYHSQRLYTIYYI